MTLINFDINNNRGKNIFILDVLAGGDFVDSSQDLTMLELLLVQIFKGQKFNQRVATDNAGRIKREILKTAPSNKAFILNLQLDIELASSIEISHLETTESKVQLDMTNS